MKDNEVSYQVWGYVWNPAKADREAEAYDFKLFKVYKTEANAVKYLEQFQLTNDIPYLKLYRKVESWDGMTIEDDMIRYADETGVYESEL